MELAERTRYVKVKFTWEKCHDLLNNFNCNSFRAFNQAIADDEARHQDQRNEVAQSAGLNEFDTYSGEEDDEEEV